MTDLVQKLVGALEEVVRSQDAVFPATTIADQDAWATRRSRALAQALAALSEAKAGGWVAVPVEPTQAMLDAADKVQDGCNFGLDDIYKAMLAARPLPNPLKEPHMNTTPAMPELPRETVIAIGKKHFPKTTLSNAWFGFAADIALATLQAQPAEVKRPQAAPVGFDVEAMIRSVLPGGNYCDPQAVADAIRDYVAASPQAVPMTASRSDRIASLQAELNLLREQEAKEIISGAPNDLRSECLALVDSRRMVGAIKHYREKVGCGLLEAKYAVEAMVTGRLAHGITAPAGQPKE